MASLLDGLLSMGGLINRVKEGQEAEIKEGPIGSLLPELTLNIDDEELIRISKTWKESWENYYKTIRDKQEQNEKYWTGRFRYSEMEQKAQDRPEADNLLFESLETALPMFTRQNPEASITCDNDEQTKYVQDELKRIADILKLKLKIRDAVRNWSLFYVGVAKINWDAKNDRIDLKIIRPQKLILDPDSYIEGGIYQGYYLGEYKTEKAKTIIKKFPNKKEYISKKCEGKLDTQITYIEWWTDEYTFWTLEREVLDKIKNPHWNYSETSTSIDEFGAEVENEVEGKNFLPYPQKPYSFLTVFNLGKHPLDDTSLFEQNLYLQDLIHKRLKQLDTNVDNMNGGWVVSASSGLTSETATTAIRAVRKGGAIYVPGTTDSIKKLTGEGLPGDVYQSLQDYRNELRNIYGVRGSSAQGVSTEQTVRGKIIVGQKDDSRMGLVAEYIEQYVDYIYNWFVQMMYVYYPEDIKAKFASKMFITVKEGSLIPDDSLTKRNEAIDLYSAGAMSINDLYKALEMPNPEEMEANLLMWKMAQVDPMGYLSATGGQPGGEAAPANPLQPAVNQTQENLMGAAPIMPQ